MKPGRIIVKHTLRNKQGFTIFEIILAMIILVIAIIPMVNAFSPALLATGQTEEQAVLTGQARSAMNGLINLDFATLDANKATPSVLVAMLGDQATAGTVVSVTDASGGAGGLLELKVTLKNVSLQTLKAAR